MQTFSEEQLNTEATIGADLQRFMGTHAGQYLNGRAEIMIQNSYKAMEDIDPHNVKEITRHQNKIKVARLFKAWVAEGISVGRHAEDELRGMDEI